MKIIIPGGSGQVGTVLATAFTDSGHDVCVLSRSQAKRPWRIRPWDGESIGDWIEELEGSDVLINLAGQSVNCRYTPENRRIIMDSRLKSTKVLGEAVSQLKKPPQVWLQASTGTIYDHRYDAPNDEASGRIGGSEPNAPDTWRFSIDVATNWERVFNEAETPRTRRVLLRSAIIMSPSVGGPFDLLLRLVRFGLGGTVGNGKQFVSWIHDLDFVRSVQWLIEHDELDGPVNVAAPNPLTNAEFMRELRVAWGMPIGLPASNGCWKSERLYYEARVNLP
ncbi:MAG TPA: NAD-dependent epimerase/dehydratase family protein [Pyrinomonadaceae bacterium]|nr:NAD-dependent epimerase/dehydratase family protein [Pyrinomonadaceae bacterium]